MIGIPDGKLKYEYLVNMLITDNKISIDKIHKFGLMEVDRIHKELKIVQNEIGYKGTLLRFFSYMRNRKDLKFKNKNEVLELYRKCIKEIEKNIMPDLFVDKIKTKCIVQPVPTYNEEFSPEAYYLEGDMNGIRPGRFFINMRNIKQMSKADIEALTLHEVVPGHHYHLSYINEHVKKPKFLKLFNLESFAEGWGLYCENLGEYSTPESYFGKLIMELLRAIRLVVDTGIHYYGWSFNKTLEYMLKNGYDREEAARQQIIRYISIPGQALCYKMGEKCIIECLHKFMKNSKNKQNLKLFHQMIIEDGIIPLNILRAKFK